MRGKDESQGQVEIGIDGVWGGVCQTGWDIQDATVICRQLGYTYALAATYDNSFGSSLNSRAWISDLACRGEEGTILDCPYTGWNVACSTDQRAGIVCSGKSAVIYLVYIRMFVHMLVYVCICALILVPLLTETPLKLYF